jgi:hypothetical protein
MASPLQQIASVQEDQPFCVGRFVQRGTRACHFDDFVVGLAKLVSQIREAIRPFFLRESFSVFLKAEELPTDEAGHVGRDSNQMLHRLGRHYEQRRLIAYEPCGAELVEVLPFVIRDRPEASKHHEFVVWSVDEWFYATIQLNDEGLGISNHEGVLDFARDCREPLFGGDDA